MRGRHARPSVNGEIAGQAARIAPVFAMAGTMLGMPHHQPPPARTIPAEHVLHAELTASVRPASPDQVYVVQAGDSLWTIAHRFYGNPLLWSRIYYANQSQIPDPNVISIGQALTIPGSGTARAAANAASATPAQAGDMPSSAPAQAGDQESGDQQAGAAQPGPAQPGPAQAGDSQFSPAQAGSAPGTTGGYLQQAAQGTGLPLSVVTAQVQVESGGQAGAISPAGAEGPYQFMPSTWATLGFPAGQEFNWATSTHAYISFMRLLLAWSGGNVRQALAAYNAGQGNWQAGLGYADQILSMSGQ